MGVTEKKEPREEGGASSSLLILASLLGSIFVFNDISFAVSPVDPGERSLLTVFCSHVWRHRRTFHSTKKENLSQTLENSLCETLVKLTQRRAAILKLA